MKDFELQERFDEAQAGFRAANEESLHATSVSARENAFARADDFGAQMQQLREAMHTSHEDMSPGALATIGKLVSRVFGR